MINPEDQLPRMFQANLVRLIKQVIVPGMNMLPFHSSLQHGATIPLDKFLDFATGHSPFDNIGCLSLAALRTRSAALHHLGGDLFAARRLWRDAQDARHHLGELVD